MQSSAKAYVSALSTEAQAFRLLLRSHIVHELQKRGHHVAAEMLGQEQQLDEYSELKQVFSRVVIEFDTRYGYDLAALLHDSPPTKSSVETFVVDVMQHILMDGHADWGRMVATAAFLTHVSIRCSEREMSAEIAPLVDYAAQLADQNLMMFIRQHGGWAAFALAFRRDEHPSASSMPSRGVTGLGIIASACAIL